MSYQPSHLEYADWGEFFRLPIHPLVHTTERNIFFSTLVPYLPLRMKTGPTKYDRVIHEVRQRVTARGLQSGSGIWPVRRIRDSLYDILRYSDAIKIPFGE